MTELTNEQRKALVRSAVLGVDAARCLIEVDGFVRQDHGNLDLTSKAIDCYREIIQSGKRIDEDTGELVSEAEWKARWKSKLAKLRANIK